MLEKILDYLRKEIPANQIIEQNNYYILPTICHNVNHDHASHKLYLYKNLNGQNEDNTPLFHCYTECDKTFNVYQLIQKREALKGNVIDYNEAYYKFHGKFLNAQPTQKATEITFATKFNNPLAVELPIYNDFILGLFPKANYGDPWHVEGIDLSELEWFDIRYSKSYEGVIIPHRDWRGNLIGVRIRTYDVDKVEKFKYMPLLVNGLYCRHPLSLNFYGLYENQHNIIKYKKAIIFESEKSVLQYQSMFGKENISLAVCGRGISEWHMNILIYYLGVEDVIIAFDKENDYLADFVKLKEQLSYLTLFARVGILVDEKNIFSLKQSPVDRTKKDFESLKIWHL